MKTRPMRILRNLLVAAIIVSMLAVTAYAVTGFLIFDSPEEMIVAIFGDNTGFDHSQGGEKYFEDGSLAAIEPTFDRIPADETLVAEEIAPHVNVVGQSITFNGYTLTVDTFLYDSATGCGFVTYLLENPAGVSGYSLQSTGEIWYDGRPDIVHVNQYGYPYIIQEKTTDTCLAATYYFKRDPDEGETLEIALKSPKQYAPDEFAALIEADVEALKQEMTPEEAIDTIRQQIGEEAFAWAFQGIPEEEIVEQCYTEIIAKQTAEKMETESTSEAICVPLTADQTIDHVTAGAGSVIVTPISLRIDITDLTFLHTDHWGYQRIDTDNIDSVAIRYRDGTEYTVTDGYVVNYTFSVDELPDENVQTEAFASPEEDPEGEGYVYIENSHGYCLSTMMFNRVIDVKEVEAVVINGTALSVD